MLTGARHVRSEGQPLFPQTQRQGREFRRITAIVPVRQGDPEQSPAGIEVRIVKHVLRPVDRRERLPWQSAQPISADRTE